jgi:hypothetical protein
MKTDRLIDALVTDRATRSSPGRSLGRSLVSALIVGGLASLVLFFATLGIRTDIRSALTTWRFDLKIVLVLVALALAFSLCLAVSRPIASGRETLRLVPLAALATIAVGIEVVILPGSAWANRLIGTNALVCLCAIPLFSAAPLVAVLAILRTGAPASPTLAGAAAGLLAATAGAALYAFHCFDDSPLFVVTWYSLAAVPVILLGAFAGRRFLRW